MRHFSINVCKNIGVQRRYKEWGSSHQFPTKGVCSKARILLYHSESEQSFICPREGTGSLQHPRLRLPLKLHLLLKSRVHSCCAGYTNIDAHNFHISFSFSIPRHSFEDSKQFCRDNNHRIIWFWEGRQKHFGVWTHFVENTQDTNTSAIFH